MDAYVQTAIQWLSATEKGLETIDHTKRVTERVKRWLTTVKRDGQISGMYIYIHELVKPFYSVSSELSIQEGLLMRGTRIVIPTNMRVEVLAQLHTGHLCAYLFEYIGVCIPVSLYVV